MKLGLTLGYSGAEMTLPVELVQRAEELGFDSAGQPWGKPYGRIRDYVSIMRKIFERDAPVTHEGKEISLPYTGEDAMGIGEPLKSILHMNPKIPIWLGTGSESNVRLTAQIADGWFPLAFVPGRSRPSPTTTATSPRWSGRPRASATATSIGRVPARRA